MLKTTAPVDSELGNKLGVHIFLILKLIEELTTNLDILEVLVHKCPFLLDGFEDPLVLVLVSLRWVEFLVVD